MVGVTEQATRAAVLVERVLATFANWQLDLYRGGQSPEGAYWQKLNQTFATGEALGRVPVSDDAEVAAAVSAARAAQPTWAARPDAERKALLMEVAAVIHGNAPMLAEWVTREQGKPLGGLGPTEVPGSRFELWGCEGWTQVPASLDLPAEVVFEDDTRRDELVRRPYGVVAAIAPWNWPLLIAIWQIVPALRAGNTVVIKPRASTRFCSPAPATPVHVSPKSRHADMCR